MNNRTTYVVCVLFAALLVGCTSGVRQPSPDDTVYVHTVKEGETLESIVEQYYGTPDHVDMIRDFNDLTDATVQAGDKIRVPLNDKDVARLKTHEQALVPYNRGMKLVEKGSYLDASAEFRAAIDIDDKFADAHYNLGVTLQKLDQLAQAIPEYKKATKLRPQNATYHFGLGNCEFYLEHYDRAAAAFVDALAMDPEHRKAQYGLAVSYEKLGDVAMARAAWERYLEIDGTSAWAIEARKRLEELR